MTQNLNSDVQVNMDEGLNDRYIHGLEINPI